MGEICSKRTTGWLVGSVNTGWFAAIRPWLVMTKSIWSMSPKDSRSKSRCAGSIVTTGMGTNVSYSAMSSKVYVSAIVVGVTVQT